ncbi:MAG TPA: PssD/Cps14F family polysaccharide biosynthesis glycosyltransferase [Gaiellaceae bacterium]|nr:PssD/Cps14F family polysaccharide biosynthesis glycosyltransferase [Gaiellaceae bacterium]
MHSRRANLLLVASPGGHLFQLWALREAWKEIERVWVTLDTADVRALLPDEDVLFAHGPTNRNLPNLLRNVVFAFRVVRRVRPLVIVTTGAGVAVPFIWIGRLFGARVVYVETLARVEGPSLSFRLVAPLVSRVYVQWPELLRAIPKARYSGTVVDHR